MNKFVVGEVALTRFASLVVPNFVAGMEVEILAPHVQAGEFGYIIDPGFLTPEGGLWFTGEVNLKKLPPHEEPSTWDDCVFKPKGVTV